MKPGIDISSGSNSERRSAVVAALLSTALSSLAILIQARLAKNADPLALAAISACFGGVFLSCLNFRSLGKHGRGELQKMLKPLACLIILRVVIGGALFWSALSFTIGAKAIFFTKAEPYFILFWQWLLERRTIARSHLWLLLIHFAGAIMLSLGTDFASFNQAGGDMLLVVAVLLLALSYRFGVQTSKQLGARVSSGITQLVGGIVLLLVGLAVDTDFQSCFEFSFLCQIIFAALLWNVLGIYFWFEALKTLEPWLVSSLRALGPLFALPVAWYFLGERLTSVQLIGATLVLMTSYVISATGSKPDSGKSQN